MLRQVDDWFVTLENRLDRVTPADRSLCGLSLRNAVMAGAVLMAVMGCYFLILSPYSMIRAAHSLFNTRNQGVMAEWAFVYVHLYLICLHLLTTVFLLYAVPLSVLACRSAYLHETKYLRSYFRMNVQVRAGRARAASRRPPAAPTPRPRRAHAARRLLSRAPPDRALLCARRRPACRQTVLLVVMGAFFNLLLDNTVCMMHGVPIDEPDSYYAGPGGYDPSDDEHCNFGSNLFKLVAFGGFAVLYVYLAWITYCYRREQEQGSQLDDDVVHMAEAAAADMRRDRPIAPIGPAGDVEL